MHKLVFLQQEERNEASTMMTGGRSSMENAAVPRVHAVVRQNIVTKEVSNEDGVIIRRNGLDTALSFDPTLSTWNCRDEPGCDYHPQRFYMQDQQPSEAGFCAPKILQPADQWRGNPAKDLVELHVLIKKEKETLRMMHQEAAQLQMKIFRQQQQMNAKSSVSQAMCKEHGNTKPSVSCSTGKKPCRSSRGRTKGQGQSGKPKRPLTAYNIFFQHERARMLGLVQNKATPVTQEGFDAELHSATPTCVQSSEVDSQQYLGKRVGFAEMAQRVSQKWKALDQATLEKYLLLASRDKQRYLAEKEDYFKRKNFISG